MSEQVKLMCCNKNIVCGEVWFLADIKGFTGRKMYKTHCPICDKDSVILIETSTDNHKTYVNVLRNIEAVKTIYREKRRKITAMPDIKTECLYGWIYGVNTQIKNKQGKITKIRQYSSDFSGKKVLSKEISL